MSYTLWNGRKRFDHNRVIAAANREDAITALGEPTRYANQSKPEAIASAAFLFQVVALSIVGWRWNSTYERWFPRFG